VSAIPESFPGVTSGNYNAPEVKSNFTGAIVYHIGENNIPAGTNILYDAEGNDYTIGNFGAAGTWMTQNLRTTDKTYDSNEISIPLKLNVSPGSTTVPYYAYPNAQQAVFDANPHYGLLYNWAAASGRTDNPSSSDSQGLGTTPPTTHYRGICPAGWHLPSDYEWSELEKEIATNPGKYSDQKTPYTDLSDGVFFNTNTMFVWRPGSGGNNAGYDTYWGRQMKSKTPVGNATNGSSFSRTDGGFDALSMGYVAGNGFSGYYDQSADFWSGSYTGSNGVYRGLNIDHTGVLRDSPGREYLFSVRCKKY
jgi:uncharacterized protein (TIGR02145 family)